MNPTPDEILAIVALIDSHLAYHPSEEIAANFYSSRLHLVRIWKELTKAEAA